MIFKRLKLKLLLALLICGSAYAQQRDAYVAIGDIYCSDGSIVTPEEFPASGKTGQGVVCYVDETGQQGWVVYYQHSGNMMWSTEYINTDVPEMAEIRDFTTPDNGLIKDCNGKANTAAITAISDYQTKYPAFKYAVGLGEGWYVPAAGQLNYMIAYTPVLNKSLKLINNSKIIMRNNDQNETAAFDCYYWSSDEATSSGNSLAWYLNTDCSFVSISKSDAHRRVRAFRDFSLSAKGNREETYRIGDVISFSDGTKGVVFSLNREHTAGTVVAMNDYNNTDRSWSAGYDDVPNLQEIGNVPLALSHTDGYANTSTVRYAADWAGSNYAYPAFKLLLDGGYTVGGSTATFGHGWYMPSAGQLRQIFAALSIAGFERSLTETMGYYNYHSSDEYTGEQATALPGHLNHFWACLFSKGEVRTLRKNYYETLQNATTYHRNRAVRDFPEAAAVAIAVNSNNTNWGRGLGSDSYLPGHQVLIGAKPEKGYRFVQWNDGNTDNPRTISVSAAATYTATFDKITESYTISVGSCDAAMGSATGSGSVQCGTAATIQATPAAGYRFVRWSDGNTQNPRSVTLYADATYTAAFASASDDAPRVHPGDILCTDGTTVAPEGYAAYTAAHEGVTSKAVVYYVDASGQHGYALHPVTYNWCWGAYNIDVDGLTTSTSCPLVMRDLEGAANTDAICRFFGDCTVAASLCHSFGPEWFLPSAGQLNILYAYLPKVKEGLAAIGATAWPETNSWYNWSSSEYSATDAWAVHNLGSVYYTNKRSNYRASASCAF